MFSVLILVTIFTTLFPTTSFASGSRVGNGGAGVKCTGQATVLLDLYEATTAVGQPAPMDWSAPTASVQDYLDQYISEISAALPAGHPFVTMITDQTRFLATAYVLKPSPILTTDDVGFVALPADCNLQQVALRGDGMMSPMLTIDKEFWAASSNRERALLIVHEAAHTWFPASDDSFVGTLAIRQLVGLLYTSSSFTPGFADKIASLVDTSASVPVSSAPRF